MSCEYCEDLNKYKAIRAELFHQTAADEAYEIDIPVNYCPNCGGVVVDRQDVAGL